MSARPVSQRLQDHIHEKDQCDSESDMTISSLPELGHMLVFCLRRIIMVWVKAVHRFCAYRIRVVVAGF